MSHNPKGAGRHPIEINWEEFDKLCAMQATQEEIAQWFQCSVDTIERCVKKKHGIKFAEYFKQKRVIGKISLRRAQYKKALDGDNTMLVWLGKQYLNQKDKQEVESKNENTNKYEFTFVEK